ncbi:hypothetical protein Pan44_22070 [Caulifigura coniformis]|uniref:Uncharacterized protein n=1 Tax=Caulifigura coniformis TaxID=2527983 RepID=A0A517SDI2_9PLAN|nr:hypothetical protein [Caulifigura coniformis]QDT54180.1 hypothetical protein Pan44_22070 [Caulifigura coniformis]
MKETESKTRLTALVAILTAILVVLAGLNVIRMQRTSAATSDAAFKVFWLNLNKQLEARETTGEFPASLEELCAPLDELSAERLKRIDYRREGTGCRVSTTLLGEKVEKVYGPRQPESPSEPQVKDN